MIYQDLAVSKSKSAKYLKITNNKALRTKEKKEKDKRNHPHEVQKLPFDP